MIQKADIHRGFLLFVRVPRLYYDFSAFNFFPSDCPAHDGLRGKINIVFLPEGVYMIFFSGRGEKYPWELRGKPGDVLSGGHAVCRDKGRISCAARPKG